MGRWRTRRRAGAGLGLLALLVQIVLSFGHVHPEDFRPAPTAASGPALAAAHGRPAPPPSLPALPDDDCPICMAVHMAASGLPSVPPAIASPVAFSRIAHTPDFQLDIPATRYILFRTRAPPAA